MKKTDEKRISAFKMKGLKQILMVSLTCLADGLCALQSPTV